MKIELIATATFGLEAVVKREIEALGYEILQSEDAKITYLGDERAIVRSNLCLRTADRVLVKMGEFQAPDFEALFQQTKALPWADWIPVDGKFTVTCSTVKSKLTSEPAIQRTVKKAIVDKMAERYGVSRFEETGAAYTVKVTLLKDRATLTIDTTGEGLHKRGYRQKTVAAPLIETMASALVQLSFYREGRVLVDPCCGSGTIAIEAAMLARNIAPGLSRTFACEDWEIIPRELWKEERKACFDAIRHDADARIYASDIDGQAVESAKENAAEAGVDDCIEFSVADISSINKGSVAALADEGIIITNPPYGERIGDQKTLDHIYGELRRFYAANPAWSLFMITDDKSVERAIFGRQADRRRKLYSGGLEVCYYQFHGKRPPKGEK